MWTVLTSSAKMPQSCRGRYRNVALVKLTQEYTAKGLLPAMISERARGVLRIIRMGHYHVGETERGAYQKALTEANDRAHRLNNTHPEAIAGEIMTWGGSA